MNSYPAFTDFFTDVAQRLTLLGNIPGKYNLFFIDTPEQADVLMNSLRSQSVFPCLCVEYYDEDVEQAGSPFKILNSAIAVLSNAEKKTKGQDDVRRVIYEICKPAAEQIFAHMLKQSDLMELKINDKPVNVSPSAPGNWIGPVHNDLYGWRIEFRWRIASGICYNSSVWAQKKH